MEQNTKVGFIGIGAQKSATSWLHYVLSKHPETSASDPKELNYFTANYDRGEIWYENFFADRPEGSIRVECSPTYFFIRSAPSRAFNYNPDLKLIAILRDPVARSFSNHLHEIRKRHIPETCSFEEAMAANPAYVEQSRYKANLMRWMEYFDRDSLLILIAEEIRDNPLKAFMAVCNHLGVSAETVPDGLFERRHESIDSRNHSLKRFLRSGGDAARAIGLEQFIKKIKNTPGIKTLLSLNDKDLRKEIRPMLDSTRTSLTELFRDDAAFVEKLLDRTDLPWPADYFEPAQEVGNVR